MQYLSLSLPGPGGESVNFKPPAGILTGGPTTLGNIIGTGFALALFIGTIVSLFMLIWGGFNWIMSEGDKQRIAQARQRLVFAILGLIIMFLSFLIINVIYVMFQIPINFLGNVR